MSDRRLAQARRLLAEAGIRAQVESAGHAGDILVVHAPVDSIGVLHALSEAVRAIGFRYVTIEPASADA